MFYEYGLDCPEPITDKNVVNMKRAFLSAHFNANCKNRKGKEQKANYFFIRVVVLLKCSPNFRTVSQLQKLQFITQKKK